MGAMASQITSLTIVYSTVYPGADQRKQQSSASLAFVKGEFPAQSAKDAENFPIWWRHYVIQRLWVPMLIKSTYSSWSIRIKAIFIHIFC